MTRFWPFGTDINYVKPSFAIHTRDNIRPRPGGFGGQFLLLPRPFDRSIHPPLRHARRLRRRARENGALHRSKGLAGRVRCLDPHGTVAVERKGKAEGYQIYALSELLTFVSISNVRVFFSLVAFFSRRRMCFGFAEMALCGFLFWVLFP